MKMKQVVLGIEIAVGLAASASAQRVTWSVSYNSGPVFVSASTHRPVFVSPAPVCVAPRPVYVAPRPVYVAPPRHIVVRPRPVIVRPAPVVFAPPAYHGGYVYCPPPPRHTTVVQSGYGVIRREGVYAYAPGPRRVFYPEAPGHPGIIQEWCPRSQAWITTGRQPHAW